MIDWTTQQISQYDQLIAEANNQLTNLITTLRTQQNLYSPKQALANMALALNILEMDEGTRTGLLLVALQRLAEQEPDTSYATVTQLADDLIALALEQNDPTWAGDVIERHLARD